MIDFKTMTTDRFLLRQLHKGDSQDVFEIKSNIEVHKYLENPLHNTIEESVEFIKFINDGYSEGKWYYWGIVKKENQKIIGTICLWNLSKDRKTAEIGYELNPMYWRQGVMKECINKVLFYGLNILKLDTIEAYTHQKNKGSIKLLIGAGFKLKKAPEGENQFAIYQKSKDL